MSASSRPLALAAALLTLSLGACDDVVRVPDTSVEGVSYVVTAARYLRPATSTGSSTPLTSRIAIEYTSPDGVKRDTISGILVSWSKRYPSANGFTPSLTAQALTPRDTVRARTRNAVGIRLKVGSTVKSDSTSAENAITVE